MVAENTPHLEVSEGDVLTVSLDRPEKLNAIDREMADSLHAVLSDLCDDPDKPLLVRGNGTGTCAGVDTDLVSDPDFEEAHADFQDTIHEIFDLLRLYPQPVGFAGKGTVVGGGLVFALNADFAVLAAGTELAFPEIKLGLSSRPTLRILADVVGDRMAKEVVMTGEPLPAERAREIGLVNQVVDETAVDATARAYLEKTIEYDADVVATIKRTLNQRDAGTFWRRNRADLPLERAL